MSALCRDGDIKPKVYAIRLLANRKMCWKWSDGSTKVQVTDDCKNLDDPRTHFIFDTSMRIHSGLSAKEYGMCVDLSSSNYKTGDIARGAACGEQPTQKFLPNMNIFRKNFAGCHGGTTKPIKYYPSAYGRILLLNSLTKCVGVEGSSGEFEGTHDIAIDECSPDLKDQEWELVPVPPRPKMVEGYRAHVDESAFEEAGGGDGADGADGAEGAAEGGGGAGAEGYGDGPLALAFSPSDDLSPGLL